METDISRLSKTYFDSWESVWSASQAVLQAYPRLLSDARVFYFNDGHEQELLCLFGTIPVKIGGHEYNIPIDLWFLPDFPFSAPVIHVVPTSTMVIKPTRVVDANGEVAGHLLFQWRHAGRGSQKHPTTAVLDAILKLITEFGERCPVVAKSSSSSSSSTGSGSGSHATHPNRHTNTPPLQRKKLHPLVHEIDKKVNRELQSLVTKKINEFQESQGIKRKLLENRDQISRAVSMANAELQESSCAIKELEEANEELSNILKQGPRIGEDSKQQTTFGSEAVAPSNPLHSQIHDLVAKEAAIEDTLYCLGKALEGETLEPSPILKSITRLSKEQFEIRIILAKARGVAGI